MMASVVFVTVGGDVHELQIDLSEATLKQLKDLDKKVIASTCTNLLKVFATKQGKESTPSVKNIMITHGDMRNIHEAGRDFQPVFFRVYRLRSVQKEHQLLELFRSYSGEACKAWVEDDNLGVFDKYIILSDSDFTEIQPKKKS